MDLSSKLLLELRNDSCGFSYNRYAMSMKGTDFYENGVYTAVMRKTDPCPFHVEHNQADSKIQARSSAFCG